MSETPKGYERSKVHGDITAGLEQLNGDYLKNEMKWGRLSGSEYAQHHGIEVKEKLPQATFDKVWNKRINSQPTAKKDIADFNGFYINPEFKKEIWNRIEHTFDSQKFLLDQAFASENADFEKTLKDLKEQLQKENKSPKEITGSLNAKREDLIAQKQKTPEERQALIDQKFPGKKAQESVEKEVLRRIEEHAKRLKLDSLHDSNNLGLKGKEGGELSEADYLDAIAKDKKIDPDVLLAARTMNLGGFGLDQDLGKFKNAEAYKKHVEEFVNRMEEAKKLKSTDPAQLLEFLKTGKKPSTTTNNTEAAPQRRQINTLWDLIKLLLEFISGGEEGNFDFLGNNNGSDYVNGINYNQTPKNADGRATPEFARKAAEKASGKGQAILNTALGELNTHEVRNSGRVREYHKSVFARGASPTGTPWCGSFVSWVLQKNGVNAKTASSRAFLGMGQAVSSSQAQPGDIVVVARGGGGHVGFFIGWDPKGKPIIVGGNQGNKVSIKTERRTLLGIRRIG